MTARPRACTSIATGHRCCRHRCVDAAPAYAAGSNMPWEQPLQQILQSIEGPVAKIVAVIIIIVTGLTLAFGDTRRLPPADPDRVRPVDRVRRVSSSSCRSSPSAAERWSDDEISAELIPASRRRCTAR